jgi:flagellar motor switch protein FliM
MGALSEEQIEATAAGKPGAGQQRSVHLCNFRSAGKLSNENARALTAIQDAFARHLTSALDAYLGSGVKVKLQALDQVPVKQHIQGIAPFCYIAPFSFSAISSTMVLEFDIDLAFPIIDLLLGGTGMPPAEVREAPEVREFSEIEEEMMQDLASLIARQAETAWGVPSTSLEPKRRIEASALERLCPSNERVTSAKFEVEVVGLTGSFQLIFPTPFINFLIKQGAVGRPQKRSALRFPTANLRERILDCDMVVAADLPSMKVSVRDLVALQPGCVLKLRAPVRTPGMLTVGGREIFEANPVRNGAQKAAQVGRRVQMTSWGKE